MGISNEQYSEIMRDYERTQRYNRDLDLANRDEVYSAIPELSEIDNAISDISTSAVIKSLNSTYDIHEANDRIQKLIQKKKDLIISHGFPADYLEPHFSCPDCKDTGYIDREPCHCLKQKIIDITFNQFSLTEHIGACDFKNFSLDYYSATVIDPGSQKSELELAKNAFRTSKKFVSDMLNGDTPNSILFYGNVGTGKTFLSNCIAKELLANGHSVIYFSATKLFDTLRESRFARDNAKSDYNKIFNSDVLIIDDLGTENLTDFNLSQFFYCLNERLLKNKPMIISTNLNVIELKEHYSERISSRIYSNFNLLKFCGDDIRLRQKINSTKI